jgi:hypothetical protein
MRYTYFVTLAESCPISLAEFTPELRVAVLVAIVYVWSTVILEISPCSLQSVVESATLDLVELTWRNLPIAVLSVSLGLRRRRGVHSGCR